MIADKMDRNVSTFLTPGELTELERIKKDVAVAGYALFDRDGVMMEQYTAPDMTVPVFANVIDIAIRLGQELGETESRPMTILESRAVEIFVICLSAARLVVYRRKGGMPALGLPNVN